MSTLLRQIVEQKRQRRIALAALSYPEKVRIVEQMREAMTHIRAVGGLRLSPRGLISRVTRPTTAER